MLFVARDAQPIPEALDGDDSLAAREQARAAAHYANFDPDDPERSKSFEFKVYRHPTVKKALNSLFHGKCAYCESRYAATVSGDIEHYRPKAAVIIEEGEANRLLKPGYWWLAADWHNLLPSCPDCNRKRGHDMPDGEHAKLGKANAFPIADESRRARNQGEEAHEVRLLLDPCRDDPAIFLRFFFDKATQSCLIATTDGATDMNRRIAETSIRVVALNRGELCTSRAARYTQVVSQARSLAKATSRFEQQPDLDKARQDVADELRDLLVFRRTDGEYTALARQIVDPLLDVLRTALRRELGAELPPAADRTDILDLFLERHPPQPIDVDGADGAAAMLALLG